MLSNVLYAKEEVEKGTPVEEIYNAIEIRKHDSCVVFIPENLTALKKKSNLSHSV